MALKQEQQEERSAEVTEEEREGEEVLSISNIKDFLKQWEAVSTVILVPHPNKVIVSRSVNIVEENIIKHYKDVLKLQQKQVLIERFLEKLQVGASTEKRSMKDTEMEGAEQTGKPQPGPSREQFLKVSEGTVPTVLLEGDNASVSSSPPT